MITLTPSYLLVPLPKGANNPTVIESHFYMPSPRVEHSIGGVDLPPGKWEIVEVDEKIAHKLIEDCAYYAKCWKNYMAPKEENGVKHPNEWSKEWSCSTRLESFKSLLESKGIENYVLIRKLQP